MIVPRLDKVLAKEKRTFYWLAKETGVSHTTLWRLKKGKAVGINFETLEKICRALKCDPGDVLFLTKDKTPQQRQASKKGRKSWAETVAFRQYQLDRQLVRFAEKLNCDIAGYRSRRGRKDEEPHSKVVWYTSVSILSDL